MALSFTESNNIKTQLESHKTNWKDIVLNPVSVCVCVSLSTPRTKL